MTAKSVVYILVGLFVHSIVHRYNGRSPVKFTYIIMTLIAIRVI